MGLNPVCIQKEIPLSKEYFYAEHFPHGFNDNCNQNSTEEHLRTLLWHSGVATYISSNGGRLLFSNRIQIQNILWEWAKIHSRSSCHSLIL